MPETNEEPTSPEAQQETFTREDVIKIVESERRRQIAIDENRIHGNAFWAEAIDHISTLASRDPFWKKVLSYGLLYKQQFEINTGQAPLPPAPGTQSKKKPPAEKTKGSGEDTGSVE